MIEPLRFDRLRLHRAPHRDRLPLCIEQIGAVDLADFEHCIQAGPDLGQVAALHRRPDRQPDRAGDQLDLMLQALLRNSLKTAHAAVEQCGHHQQQRQGHLQKQGGLESETLVHRVSIAAHAPY